MNYMVTTKDPQLDNYKNILAGALARWKRVAKGKRERPIRTSSSGRHASPVRREVMNTFLNGDLPKACVRASARSCEIQQLPLTSRPA